MNLELFELKKLYTDGVYTLTEIRLMLWVKEHDLQLDVALSLLKVFIPSQIKEIICIPGYWLRFFSYIKPNYHPKVIGLIRDLSYFDYSLSSYNFDIINYEDISYLRREIKLPNLLEKQSYGESEVFDDILEDDDIEDISSDIEIDSIDALLSIFQDPIINSFSKEIGLKKEKDILNKDFFYYESELSFKNYVENVVLENAILINKNDEKSIFDNIHKEKYYSRFFNGNIRLGLHYAKRYRNTTPESHHADILQVSLIGIINAMEKFDSSLNFKFSTFAHWHINQQIRRYIHNNISTIRIPVHKREELYKLERTIRDYSRFNMVLIDKKIIIDKMPELELEELDTDLLYLKQTVSIETLDRIETEMLEETHSINSANEYADYLVLNEEIRKLIKEFLPERSLFIIKHRYGIDTTHEHTLEELGILLNVTRERVRQIQANAIRKLKKNKKVKQLYFDFIYDEN